MIFKNCFSQNILCYTVEIIIRVIGILKLSNEHNMKFITDTNGKIFIFCVSEQVFT